MSSSTSSFRNELKVVTLVVAVLLSCEVLIRLGESSLSKDVQHIAQIPTISQRLVQREGTRVLFVGNSLIRKGIDPEILQPFIERERKVALQIERIFPDGTGIPDWYYAFKHHFVDRGHLPDVLVVSFAERSLQDDQRVHSEAIARYYSGWGDTAQIFANDIPDFGDRTEFLLSKFWFSYVNRRRVETRLLSSLIPYYRDSAQQVNSTMKAGSMDSGSEIRPSFHRLERLLSLARDNRVKVIVVAMPVQNQYELDPQICQIVRNAGAEFLDCRAIAPLKKEHYEDQMHLNSAGATVFSAALAKQFAQHSSLEFSRAGEACAMK